MRRSHEPSHQLLEMAAAHNGIVTRQELLADGVSDKSIHRHLRTRQWHRLLRGVYLLHNRRVTWMDRAHAALVACGHGASLGWTSAAYVLGLTRTEPERPGLWVPRPMHRQANPRFEIRRDGQGRLERAALTQLPGARSAPLPVTNIHDTVLDTVRVLDRENDVIAILTAANRRRDFSIERVHDLVTSRPRSRHHDLLMDFFQDCRGVESVLEYHFVRRVLQAHGLPSGQRQVSLTRGKRHDLVFKEFRLIIELDGAAHHGTEQARFRDMQRDNASAAQGFTTLRFGWQDVTGRPCQVAAQVARALHQHGWDGRPHPCASCAEQSGWKTATA